MSIIYQWYVISFYIFDIISMEEYDNTTGPEEIIHVQERADGSSDGLPEALDIDLGNGYRECSNWNLDLNKKWKPEVLFGETTEPTAEELVEIFNKTKEELFPGKEKLTPKEEAKVYEKMTKTWNNNYLSE